ncbi:glycosyl transferase [Candidatus Saccharibacteria bacterium]|nr:MAG: glycosyl transferase [Candidatus Saccharibacteria bacterium]
MNFSADDAPTVSIVTPVHNAAEFIADTIVSVQAQTYVDWELLLIDDCSTDESVEIIRSYQSADPRIKLLHLEQNEGAAVARNKGTEQAHGRYLAFLDADDVWLPAKLETQVAFMQKNTHAFTYTGYEFADANAQPNGNVVAVPTSITYKQALKNHIIWTSTVMLDLEQVDRAVAYMPNVRRGQDAATWWQILRAVGTAYGINRPLAYYRRTHTSLSANKLKAAKRTWYLLRHVEELPIGYCVQNFLWYGYNAVRKRL